MTETLQDRIELAFISNDKYKAQTKSKVDKAIQELREEIIALPSVNDKNDRIYSMRFISLSDVLALIGEKNEK